jgi:hypothetical protein
VEAGASASGGGATRLASADYGRVVRSVRDHVRKVVPAGEAVLVLSRGDDELLNLGDRVAGHFPQAEDGRYLGYYPEDSESAIAMLETLRAAGSQYIVFPSTAFWWLEHYAGLRRHLQDNYHLIGSQRDSLIFALGDVPPSIQVMGPDEGTRDAMADLVKHLLPAGALIVVASLGDEEQGAFGGLRTWQLPLGSSTDGAGAPEAHLETMQRNGAEFLILPKSAFEWLKEHDDLAKRLLRDHVLVTHQEHVCDIYEMCPPKASVKPDAMPAEAPARERPPSKSIFESLFGWIRRPSANGRPV